jgi:hypothetical protein
MNHWIHVIEIVYKQIEYWNIVKNMKHGESATFWGYIRQIHRRQNTYDVLSKK